MLFMNADINECEKDADNECYSSDLCTNNRGGYTCTCPAGLKLKADGVTCEGNNADRLFAEINLNYA